MSYPRDDPPGRPSLGEVHTPPARRDRPSWVPALLAVGLVLLVAAVAAAFLLGGVGTGPGTSPTPELTPTAVAGSPSPGPQTPSATPATPAPTTGATAPPASPAASPAVGRTPEPAIAGQIDLVVSQIPPLRELEPLHEVPYVLLSRDEFREELAGLLEDEVDREQLATEQRLLIRLGLLPPDADLYELLLQLYGSQIAAYYRPDTGSFYIIERDAPFEAMDRMIVAHEYTHALQDQHFDLAGNRITDPSEGDAALAQLAAIEGDASLVMYQWAFTNLGLDELLELFAGMAPAPTDQELLESMPEVLRRQLRFPYHEGFLFTIEIQGTGGWSAVDETLRRPPASTEQVLHPQKYVDDERPVPIAPPDLQPVLGEGWQRTYQQTMGELNLQVWLADGERPPLVMPGLPAEETDWQAAAAGWGGDRLVMYEGPAGSWVISWTIGWDTAADGAEFATIAEPLVAGLASPAVLVEGPAQTWTVFVASDEELLAAVNPLE